MGWPFAKKQQALAQRVSTGMVFKNTTAAFEVECRYRNNSIEKNVALVALVEKAGVNKDGVHVAVLKIASDDGGFPMYATTPSERGERLHVGDLVYWVPYRYVEEIASGHADPRSGWIGFIRAKLLPEFAPGNQEFLISYRYD